MFRFK